MADTPVDVADPQFAERVDDASTLLKSLANPHRLMLLCRLMSGECSVGELNELVPLSQSALSQHLAWLRRAGMVTTRRQNQTIFYRIENPDVCRVIETLHGIYCTPDN